MLQEIQLVPGQNCVVVSSTYNANGIIKNNMEKRTIAIAPATDKHSFLSQSSNSDLVKCRKKINFKTNPYTGPQAASIARRNARERNRVKQVNDGFAALRRHLPASVVAALSNGARRGAGKKLSKVDTLRMVVEYIRYLQQLLDEGDANLGITRESYTENCENMLTNTSCSPPPSSRMDQSFLYGGTSPCSEMAPSPSPSESSSGVSSGYSINTGYPLERDIRYDPVAQQTQLSPMDEEELLDVISWWQQK